jgi:hypothetical protein
MQEVEPDSGEGYWRPVLSDPTEFKVAYWEEREKAGKAKQAGQDGTWPDVVPIFGSYALL